MHGKLISRNNSVSLSVIILTHNEERNLPTLLGSLDWCDDVHVVDDESTDSTLSLASRHAAKCHSHRFESFGNQRNWALEHCDLQNPWVLFLDADEVSTPAFARALLREATRPAL